MVHVKTPNQPEIPDIAALRCGVQRDTMRTNALIHRAGISEVNKIVFANPPMEKAFGVPKQSDPEGARDLTMVWQEHAPNPDDVPVRGRKQKFSSAGPDFLSMNKLAAIKGLTNASSQKPFRQKHPIFLKKGEAVKRPPPLLPSDVNPKHTYGTPGTYRSAEQIRNAGPVDPPMKPLIQSQYTEAWVKMNNARANEFDLGRSYIAPKQSASAKAAKAKREAQSQQPNKDLFKLSKFKTVDSKVKAFMGAAKAEKIETPIHECPVPELES